MKIKKEFSINGFYLKTVVNNFGFASGGQISYEVSFKNLPDLNTSIESWRWEHLNIWLVIVDENQKIYNYMFYETSDLCIAPSYTRFEMSRYLSGSTTLEQDGLYSIMLLCCSPHNDTVNVGVNLVAYNWNKKIGHVQHLPIESVMLPSVYFFFSILYLALFLWWLLTCINLKPFLRRIHFLFMLTLLSKLASETALYLEFSGFNTLGNIDGNLELTSRLATRYSYTVFLFTGFLLSFGWTITKAQLPLIHRVYIAVPFLSYFIVVAGISLCDLDKTNQKLACNNFYLAEDIVNPLGLLLMVFFANLTIHELRCSILTTRLNSEAAVLYSKIAAYKSFLWCVIMLVLVPMCMGSIQVHILSWHYSWLALALKEMVQVLIYINIGVTFCPFNEQVLTRAFVVTDRTQV